MTGDQPTVLIVDDSEGVCLAVSMMLEKHGFRTQTAHSASDGLRLAQNQHFDVILMDRTLGTESGLVVAEQLLQSDPGARIVVMSGSVTVRSEMDRHPRVCKLPLLLKPFSQGELLDCLRAILDCAA
jgi:DNA-binding NtrC family response regulator